MAKTKGKRASKYDDWVGLETRLQQQADAAATHLDLLAKRFPKFVPKGKKGGRTMVPTYSNSGTGWYRYTTYNSTQTISTTGTTDNDTIWWAYGGYLSRSRPRTKTIRMMQPLPLLPDAYLRPDGIRAPGPDLDVKTFTTLTEHYHAELMAMLQDVDYLDLGRIKKPFTLKMRDGTYIEIVDGRGNFRLKDDHTRTVYAANRNRDFSPYMNASDLLEEFIDFLASNGVRQCQFLDLPIELFINWLILRAAQRDGDPVPDGVVSPEQHPKTRAWCLPKCLTCGRFLPYRYRDEGIKWCNDQHLALYMERRGLAPRALPKPQQ